MTWREVCEADLMECLNIEPRHLGDEIVGRERALAIWKDLIRTRSFNSAVIESSTPVATGRIVAFGSSVFVKADFATRELEDPKPGLNSRVVASIASGKSVVLTEKALCSNNARDALDIVILGGDYLYGVLSTEQVGEAEMMLAFSFMELHVGYRLNRILLETTSDAQRRFHESSGVWRIVKSFPSSERALAVLTREEAFSACGSIAAPLFQYQDLVLRLRDTDKHLLSEAVYGETDTELAARLNLSLSTVKKRWNSLFARVAETRSDLLPNADTRENESRGLQKRHRILSYVRAHPQEVRPYRWRSFKQV